MPHLDLPSVSAARYVPWSELRLEVGPLNNIRKVAGLSKEAIAEMADSIADKGILTPLSVMQVVHEDGKTYNFVLNGQRRWLAAEVLVKAKKLPADYLVPVTDRHPAPVELTRELEASLIEDQLEAGKAEGLSSYELLLAAERLIALGKKQAHVAPRLRRSESWLSRMWSAWKVATEDLKAALRDNRISDEQFRDLAAVKQPERQREAVTEILDLRAKNDRTARSEAAALSRVIAEEAKAAEPAKPPKGGKKAKKYTPADPPGKAAKDKAVKGKKAEVAAAPAPKAPAKPSTGDISDIARFRDQRSGSKHAYVRGVVDFAAYVLGKITFDELGAPLKSYLKAQQRGRK